MENQHAIITVTKLGLEMEFFQVRHLTRMVGDFLIIEFRFDLVKSRPSDTPYDSLLLKHENLLHFVQQPIWSIDFVLERQQVKIWFDTFSEVGAGGTQG